MAVSVLSDDGDIGGKRCTTEVSCGAVAGTEWLLFAKLLPIEAVHSQMAMAKTIVFFII